MRDGGSGDVAFGSEVMDLLTQVGKTVQAAPVVGRVLLHIAFRYHSFISSRYD